MKKVIINCKLLYILVVTFLFIVGDSDITFAQGQKVTKANYKLAEKFAPENLNKFVYDTYVVPNWIGQSDRFWYSFKTGEGNHYYLVDPAKRTKKLLFDNAKLAAQLSEELHKPFDPQHLSVSSLEFVNSEKAVQFIVDSCRFECNLVNMQVTFIDSIKPEEKIPDWVSFSPDSLTIVYAKNHNLFMMKANDPDSVEIQLTTDGELNYSYAIDYHDTTCNERFKVMPFWSPDSKKFFLFRDDVRKMNDLWVVHSLAQPRPTLESYKYPMPGDDNVLQRYLYVFDREKKSGIRIKADNWKDQNFFNYYTTGLLVTWDGSSDKLYVGRISRDFKKHDVCVADPETGEVRVLFEEEMSTYMEPHAVHVINKGSELIQWSERDGWAHFYLYDGEGKLKNQITSGPYVCQEVVKIDTTRRVLYFRASGREKGEDPYYFHLYRVNFDGTGLRLLNPENATHMSDMSSSMRYFVDNFSRVDTEPKIVLRDSEGNMIMELETADLSLLLGSGFKFPETFNVKAEDGITDLYGVMWKPFDFDPEKKYPIIAWVYPGPQTELVPKAFQIKNYQYANEMETMYYSLTVHNIGLSQFGFIVIAVGSRGGHPHRSKAYHNYGYGNLRDYAIADKKGAIEQLAARHSFIDIDKVGIFGHSGGGFMSTAAMLVYPDFFKVAVSGAGNHDNNIYNQSWSEKHHGVEETVDDEGNTKFKIRVPTNPEVAKNLKGHLLLFTGDVDNNVHPSNSLRVADALIKAGKRFDFFVFPGKAHGYYTMYPYLFWLTGDYFCKHLIGDFDSTVDISGLNSR